MVSSQPDNALEILKGHLRDDCIVCSAYRCVDDKTLLLLKLQNPLFDRILRYEFHDTHLLLLSDTVGAVRSLVLYGRVPPRVEMDHGIRTCEIEACSTGMQGYQKNRNVALVELPALSAFFHRR